MPGLVDWARSAGLNLIQLLPITDTLVTKTWKDSYPYSSLSVFALHPMVSNLCQRGFGEGFHEEVRFAKGCYVDEVEGGLG